MGHRADLKEARDVVFALDELRSSAMTDDEKERLIALLAGADGDPGVAKTRVAS